MKTMPKKKGKNEWEISITILKEYLPTQDESESLDDLAELENDTVEEIMKASGEGGGEP